ncbi:hypothetical protein M0805_001878 [Coniferiporia weirii]|nr:hypothetical protein M0805_001878 [Coniferiporia weirii]
MSTLSVGSSESVSTDVGHLMVVRYLTLSGFTVLLYDVFLTFSDEYEIIWSSRHWTLPKIAYVINRYGAIALSIFYLGFLMPLSDRSQTWVSNFQSWKRCMNAGTVDMVLDVSIETLGNGIVLYELIKLWGSKKRIACLMAAGFILVHSATIASLGLVIVQMRHHLTFVRFDDVRTCFSSVNPSAFKGVYIPAVVLDIYAFVLLLFNALSRPRSSSQKLLDLLWGDGAIFFLTTFSMRMMCLIINVVAPPSLAVLGLSFASAMVASAVSRLYLRLNLPDRQSTLPDTRLESVYGGEYLLDDITDLQFRRASTKKSSV